MFRPEREFSLGVNKENPEASPIPQKHEDLTSPKTPEVGEEQPLFQPEIPKPQEIFSSPESRREQEKQVEIQPHQERELSLEQLLKKPLNWVRRKIEKGEEKGELLIKWAKEKEIVLTEEDKRKLLYSPILGAVHGYICLSIGIPTLAKAFFLWRAGNYLHSLSNLMTPGLLKFASIFFYEKIFGVEFSWISKGVALLWPFVGGGSAVLIEIAHTLGEKSWLFSEIKRRLTFPLRAAQKVRSVFKR